MCFDPIVRTIRRARAMLLAASLAAPLTSALAASTQPTPTIDIATAPLSLSLESAYSNVMLTLSVEFPTVGAAYRGPYRKTETYLGYFNPNRCYSYDEGAGYFVGKGNANTAHECVVATDGKFSGNFMNWATASAMDVFRMAMTGGDRVIDTPSETVLQRALLPSHFFASHWTFPLKGLDGSGENSEPSKVTPFGHGKLYIASCGNHVFFSPTYDPSAGCYRPGGYGDTATERRAFRVQVKVCDAGEATSRGDLCHRYQGSNYKPIGEMQRNAGKARFAAFGYLNDSDWNRYGGVLRAPMRYVGPTATDDKFQPIGNPAPEWDKDGVLRANPLGDKTYGQSGVINYLNKFGRTQHASMGAPGTNPSGSYKQYDPIGELYYESLRYLHRHPDGPTPEAFAGGWQNFTDSFPAYRDWKALDDPLLGNCQRNYVILIGDINTNFDNYVPGNTKPRGVTGDAPRPVDPYSGLDVMAETDKVGRRETNTPASTGNAKPLPADFLTLGAKFLHGSPRRSYYVAGLAYWAHTSAFHPQRKEARVTTYAIDVNEGGDGTIHDWHRQSQIYLAAKYGGFRNELAEGGNADGNPFQALGADGAVAASDREWEAAPPGSNLPYNWFLASQPRKMIDAIKQIFAQISSGVAGTGGMALSTHSIRRGGPPPLAFVPGYDAQWNGTLTAYDVRVDPGKGIALASAQWEAGERLGTRAHTSRAIFSLDSAGRGMPFTWAALDAAQKTSLDIDPDTGTADGRGEQRAEYVRGDRAQETATPRNARPFRGRRNVLGDAVNAGPVHVGGPSGNAGAGGARYEAFRTRYAARTPMVYLAANDGMLHGFAARTGHEVFAYVPRSVVPALNQLTSPAYAHRNFVDATPVTADAEIGGTWRTVLAGGLGGGGQGLYALDITDPEGGQRGRAFGEADVLWEFTDRDDADMGNVMSAPIIAKLRTGTDNRGAPIEAWFVIAGNGLNANLDDGHANPAASGALFLLRLDKPAGQRWQLDRNYYKIVTPRGMIPAALQHPNGLSAPTGVANAAGVTQTAYAGDLLGQLWKFDLTRGASTWHGGRDGAIPAYGEPRGTPFFSATSTAGEPRPITMAPSVAHAVGGHMVLFGTGKYYELADARQDASDSNAFYGVFDDGQRRVEHRGRLNTLIAMPAHNGAAVAWLGKGTPPGHVSPARPGWVFEFIEPAERQVGPATLQGGFVHFNSMTTSTRSCSSPGSSRNYALNALTGLPSDTMSGTLSAEGILGPPVTVSSDPVVDARNNTGQIRQAETQQVLSLGTTGQARPTAPTRVASIAGRLSWREIRHPDPRGQPAAKP